jgi:hypothetical protein
MPDVELSTALWRFVIIAALLIGVGCCIFGAGCATDAMRRGFEQIYHDNAAGEHEDVGRVSQTAMNKYGRSGKHTDSTTTEDTCRDIEADKMWKDYLGGGMAWLWKMAGWEEAVLLTLMTALGIYQKVKNKRLKKDNEQMVEAGMGIPEFGDKVAKMQAKEMPLNKTVQKIKLKNGKEKI